MVTERDPDFVENFFESGDWDKENISKHGMWFELIVFQCGITLLVALNDPSRQTREYICISVGIVLWMMRKIPRNHESWNHGYPLRFALSLSLISGSKIWKGVNTTEDTLIPPPKWRVGYLQIHSDGASQDDQLFDRWVGGVRVDVLRAPSLNNGESKSRVVVLRGTD